jgi:hypothetical protein
MHYREFVAQATLALIQGNASGISGRNPVDAENIDPQVMIKDAVVIAYLLETNGLAPWVGANDGAHKTATDTIMALNEQSKSLQEEKKKEQEEQSPVTATSIQKSEENHVPRKHVSSIGLADEN